MKLQGFLCIESLCGEKGIRTPGPVKDNGFQDRRIRPLCHLSGVKDRRAILEIQLSAEFCLIYISIAAVTHFPFQIDPLRCHSYNWPSRHIAPPGH